MKKNQWLVSGAIFFFFPVIMRMLTFQGELSVFDTLFPWLLALICFVNYVMEKK